jgi:hypothetical protein
MAERATPEDIARIDAALEKTRGNRAHAAAALGLHPDRVYTLVDSNPHLKAKWSVKPPNAVEPTEAAEIHREPALAMFSPGDVAAVTALNKQDAQLRKGWAKLPGFSPTEQTFLADLQTAYAGNLKGAMDLSYGGASHANIRLLFMIEKISAKIQDIHDNPQNYELSFMTEHGTRVTKTANEYLKEFGALLTQMISEARKMGDSMTKINQLRLQMEKLRMARESDDRKKAGWDVAQTKGKTP